MKKYLALYYIPRAALDEWDKKKAGGANLKEEMEKEMKVWSEWMKAHKDIFADMGSGLGKTKRITTSGVSDTKNELTGYSIVKADSHDAATRLFSADHPHFAMPGAYIEVLELVGPGL
jgi:hypothetical protein